MEEKQSTVWGFGKLTHRSTTNRVSGGFAADPGGQDLDTGCKDIHNYAKT